MKLDDSVSIERVFSSKDVKNFEALSNMDVAPGAVPEPMIAALFSYLLGVRLPGPGTNYLKQSLDFSGKALIDERLSATIKVTRLRSDKHLADFETVCRNAKDEIICSGRALVRYKDAAV